MDEAEEAPTRTEAAPRQRVSPLVRAVQRLHKLPTAAVGETLRAQLSEERRAWAAELLKGL